MNSSGSRDPLVSVVIPAHNASRFLAETLSSACEQTYTNLEITVVDDGSTDDTASIVELRAQSDPRIRVIRQPQEGPSAARNTGIAYSNGEFIAPLDSDDLWHPGKLEAQVRAMQEGGPSTGLVYSWHTRMNERGLRTGRVGAAVRYSDMARLALGLHNYIGPGSNPLLRRTVVDRVGGYPEHADPDRRPGAEDIRFYAAVAAISQLRAVPEVHVAYRLHSGGISGDLGDMRQGHELLMKELELLAPDPSEQYLQWSRLIHSTWMLRRAVAGRAWSAAAIAGRSALRDAVSPDRTLLLGKPLRAMIRAALGKSPASSHRTGTGGLWDPTPREWRSAERRATQMNALVEAIADSGDAVSRARRPR